MPRTLPWLVQGEKKKPTAAKQALSSSSPAPGRKRATTPDDLVDGDLNTTVVVTPERRARRRQARSPSTSPAPTYIAALPEVEYMREGYSADDIWMMVEDEFHSTAQTFTQHIHHAEYVRLKKLAKSRGASTLQAIARGTDGRTALSGETKLQREAEAKGKQIKAGLKSTLGHDESDEEDDEYMHDPQLAGLMTGSQHAVGQDLTRVAKVKSKTRAAAGFLKSPQKLLRTRDAEFDGGQTARRTAVVKQSTKPAGGHRTSELASNGSSEDEDDDDDDLDAPLTAALKSAPARSAPEKRGTQATSSSRSGSTMGFFTRFAEVAQSKAPTTRSPEQSKVRHKQPTADSKLQSGKVARVKSSSPSSDSDSKEKRARSQANSDFLARRRAAKAKAEQEEKRKGTRTYDSVPTFAI